MKADPRTTKTAFTPRPFHSSTAPKHSVDHLWFSSREVPDRSIWLSTGEPIPWDLAALIEEGIARNIEPLQPGRFYAAKWLVGVDVWNDLDNGDRRRAGRYLADIARQPNAPFAMLERNGRPDSYYRPFDECQPLVKKAH